MKKLMILAALASGLALFGGENTAKADHRGCNSGFSSGGLSFGGISSGSYAPQTSYYRPSYYGGGNRGYGNSYGGYSGYSGRSGVGYYSPGFSISLGSGRLGFGNSGRYGSRGHHSHHHGR